MLDPIREVLDLARKIDDLIKNKEASSKEVSSFDSNLTATALDT